MNKIRANARPGFTLIELLIVIAIIGVLAALSAGAYFRIADGQRASATEATLSKLNTGLDRRWRAVIDQAAEDARENKIPTQVKNFAGGNVDRARTIWTYMLLKNEFPTTLDEARTFIVVTNTAIGAIIASSNPNVPFPTPSTSIPPGAFVLQPRTVYGQLPAGAPSASLEIQSAACFYLALTATGNRGEMFGSDGTNNQTMEIELGGKQVTVFVDTWGIPIAFSRMSYSDEINSYAKSALRDPLDQTKSSPTTGQLSNWAPASLKQFWDVVQYGHIVGGNMPATYMNQNWTPTLISAGPNEEFGNLLGGDDNGADNVLSFRLRKEGQRGD